jgi:hypothetical protein
VSLLLNKDAKKRPDAVHVLLHPFITGKRVSRLQGEDAKWDVFLSYRVCSHHEIDEMLDESLVAMDLKCGGIRRACYQVGTGKRAFVVG